jgi:hypothetical protein
MGIYHCTAADCAPFLPFAATDRFGETGGANGSFGALGRNSRCWSSRASGNLEVLARNLTFWVPSNQAAAKLLVMDASNVPQGVSCECKDRLFAAMAQGAKADLQTVSSFSLTWLAPVHLRPLRRCSKFCDLLD